MRKREQGQYLEGPLKQDIWRDNSDRSLKLLVLFLIKFPVFTSSLLLLSPDLLPLYAVQIQGIPFHRYHPSLYPPYSSPFNCRLPVVLRIKFKWFTKAARPCVSRPIGTLGPSTHPIPHKTSPATLIFQFPERPDSSSLLTLCLLLLRPGLLC